MSKAQIYADASQISYDKIKRSLIQYTLTRGFSGIFQQSTQMI